MFFWESMGLKEPRGIEITLLNLTDSETSGGCFKSHVGDARDMPEFEDGSFDVVFSNSVIEHVGGIENQRMMASEIARVGKGYFLQTPNRLFLFETHFRLPLFQFVPYRLRVFLVRNFGFIGKRYRQHNPGLKTPEELVDSVRLLSRRQIMNLFPKGTILEEKFMGMTKSFMVYNTGDLVSTDRS